MYTRIKLICFSLSLIFVFSSCGVMFGGSKYLATIEANNHPNAQIYISGEKMGTGKTTLLLPRNEKLQVELRQEGCEPQVKNFNKKFRTGNFILSLLSWGLVGVAVDLGTGASYKPDHINHPEVQKVSTKNFLIKMDYEGCPTN